MPLLQVRDFPEEVYESLAKVAKEDNRSISQETIVLIRSALNQEEERHSRRKRVIEEINNMNLGETDKFPDPVLLIREDRDR